MSVTKSKVRQRLPNRRGSVMFALQVGGFSFIATAGRFAIGLVGLALDLIAAEKRSDAV